MGKIKLGARSSSRSRARGGGAEPPAGSVEEPVPVLRVDAGGAGAAGSPTWQADTAGRRTRWATSAAVGAAQVRSASGAVSLADPSIPAGTPAAVFRRSRGLAGGGPQPHLEAAGLEGAGPGAPLLRRARRRDTGGGRVFDVLVEGALVDDDLDVVARTGGVRRGLVRTYDVTVAGPTVDIVFRWKVKPPAVAGLELLEAPPAATERCPPGHPHRLGRCRPGRGAAVESRTARPRPATSATGTRWAPVRWPRPRQPIDTGHASLPVGTPAGSCARSRVDTKLGQAKPRVRAAGAGPGHLRGPGVLRRGPQRLHGLEEPGAGRLRERRARR